MTAFSAMLSTGLLDRLGWTLLHSLWQFAAIGLFVGASLAALRRQSARLRYGVACLGMVAMMASCVLTFAWWTGNSADAVAQSAPEADDLSPATDQRSAMPETLVPSANQLKQSLPMTPDDSPGDDDTRLSIVASSLAALLAKIAPWLSWMAVAWIGGVVVLSLRNVGGWIGVQRLQRIGTKPARPQCVAVAKALLVRMKIERAVRIAESTVVQIPIVVGWLRPMVLLPVCLLGEMSPVQLEAILAHELAHIRRHDYLANIVQTAIETLLFYHPAVWWVSRQIRNERENCCDDAAVEICGSGLGLSEALILVAVARAGLQPALAATGHRPSSVVWRVQRLLNPKAESNGHSQAFGAAVVLALLTVLLTVGWSGLAIAEYEVEEPADEPPNKPATKTIFDAGLAQLSGGTAEKERVSGRIVLADGTAATAKGTLFFYAATETAVGVNTSFATWTGGEQTDRFSVEVPAGTVWLKYFAEGFAPAWLGPLKVESGSAVRDLTLVLRPGFSCPVQVSAADGTPISKATLVALPEIGGNTSGPVFKKTTNEQGQFRLEHLAETPYLFRVEAPGYEPLNTNPQVLKPEGRIALTMTRSQPTTGVVLGANGEPAVAAKIRLQYEATFLAGAIQSAQSGMGQVVATTDAAGRFVLDQLTSTSRYLFVVEATDKSRVVLRDVRAGQRDLRIELPKRRDLRVRLVGDLSRLPQRDGKPFVQFRQEISIGEENLNHIDLIGEDVSVSPTVEGGLAEYQGLVDGTVRVVADHTFEVDGERTTEVVVQMPEAAPGIAKPAAARSFEPLMAIYVMRPDGSAVRKLAETPDHDQHETPRWSHDGKRVLFSASGGKREGRDFYVVNADGSGLTRLGDHGHPDWSPDDKQIVYDVYSGDRESFIQNFDGSGRIKIAGGVCPRWSADGSQIAVTDHKMLRVVDMISGEATELFDKPFEYIFAGYNWSPDGKWLALSAKTTPTSKRQLLLVSSQGEKQGLKLLQTSEQGGSISFSPNGKRLVFADGWKLRIMDIEGNGQSQLIPDQRGHSKDPHWSPDGEWIVFGSDWDRQPFRLEQEPSK